MNYQADAKGENFVPRVQVVVSEDGYVRLTFETFSNFPLFHLLSGVDEDNVVSSSESAIETTISGYTEWISSTKPAITLGWDWQLIPSLGSPRYVRVGQPRSNIMLVDARQRDLGPVNTAMLLNTVIDRLPWQDAVIRSPSYPAS